MCRICWAQDKMLRIAHIIATWSIVPLSLGNWLVCYCVNLRKIYSADVIIQSTMERAFGNTYNILELVRRMYPEQRIAYFAFRDGGNHNRKLSDIFGELICFVSWPRIRMRFWLFGRQVLLPPNELHDPLVAAMGRWFFKIFGRSHFIIIDEYDIMFDKKSIMNQLVSKVDELKSNSEAPRNVPDHPFPNLENDYLLYKCFLGIEAPQLRLPNTIRKPILERLASVQHEATTQAKGFCGLFLKCDPPDDKPYKNGSEIDCYLPALTRLVEAGYHVLVQGDRVLTADMAKQFQGRVIDHVLAGVCEDHWNLFVATECDIFVGESGPGTWMALSRPIPILALNVWPIGEGMCATWIYFKPSLDAQGEVTPYRIALSESAYSNIYEKTFVPRAMTADENCAAVEIFLLKLWPDVENDDQSDLLDLIPAWTTMRALGVSKISPAWIEHHVLRSDGRVT